MTFRVRIVLAAATAVVVAVVLASLAAYVVARDSLIGSIDDALAQDAQVLTSRQTVPAIPEGCGPTICVVVVDASGTPSYPGLVPISPATKAVAGGAGSVPGFSADITVSGVDARELVTPLPTGFEYRVGDTILALPAGGALVLTSPLTAVDHELRNLLVDLSLIASAGIALAVVLGLLVGRTAFVPLNALTGSIEELAETIDVSQRLDPGGRDELGRLRRAFNRLLEAVDRSREAQRQLVVDAGHELRTPLTSLRTNMEVARRLDELEPEERQVLIGDVLTQLDELTTLVADLVELARGERPDRALGSVRLDWVVTEAVTTATTHGRSRGVEFRSLVEPTWVTGDRVRIGRAIGNLLDNALKWSPDGGVVDVTCRAGVVEVRDHGPGVDPSDLPHLFDRFYRSPAARGKPGSGLGLAIVAQVAEDEGATVTAGNAEGGGAVFRMQFPPPDADATRKGVGRSGGRAADQHAEVDPEDRG